MSKQELVDKNEVLSIWHNYWKSDKLAYEAEDELRELKTIICITELNENQQIVLDWLKEKYTVTNIEPIELFWRLRVNSIKPDYRDRPVYRSYRYMSKTGQLQVLQAFSRWAIEQEEAE